MKSQKQRNRAPRPFKNNGGGGGGWSDGGSFIPVSKKPTLPVKKADAAPQSSEPDKGTA